MGKKRGLDDKKIAVIIGVLYNNPDGIWLRRIAREAKMDDHTVARYVNSVLRPLVEDVSLAGENKAMLRVIRLKPFVIEKLAEGRNIQQILRIMQLLGQAGQ